MIRLLEWLLDLEDIRLARDAPLRVHWAGDLDAWIVACLAVVVGIAITLIYRREQVSTWRRIATAAVRFALAALLIAVICQPVLVLQRDRIEPSHVAVVLDTSQSMSTRDVYSDRELASSIARGAGLEDPDEPANHTRLDLVKRTLLRDQGAAYQALLSRNRVRLYTFAGTTQLQVAGRATGTTPEGARTFLEATGNLVADGAGSDLAGAIREVIAGARGSRLAAVVIATDGQATGPGRLTEALDMARGRQVPIMPLIIGSPTPRFDIEVGPLKALESVFLEDLFIVEARITARGLPQQTQVTVSLVDEGTGLVVAAKDVTLEAGESATSIELRTKPTRPGQTRYRVEVAPLEGESSTANNADRIDVTILEERLKVLYVEGYPRFEYRYLKNALLREETVWVSILLLEADEAFVQEGTEPIRRFPATPEELARYDVVLFGDVDPRGGWLSSAQMDMLVDFVGKEGGGFGLIAGERSTPHGFSGTPIAKLIPVLIDPEFLGRYETTLTSGFRPVLTPEGRQSRIFRFTADRSDGGSPFDSLPELFWIARTLGPKPGASVLAEHPTAETISGKMPLVVTGRYGAGRLFFQATDDTWRWRRHTGEFLHDTYWVRVLRELARPHRTARDRRFVIRSDRKTYRYGDAVRAGVQLFDSDLLVQMGETIPLSVLDDRGFPVVRFTAYRTGEGASLFEGSFHPPTPGGFRIKADDIPPRPGEMEPSAVIRVDQPDLESRRVEADHEVLERMARATGGRLVPLDQLESVLATIRDRSVRTPDDVTEPLWDSKLIVMLFVLMISLEWILRKAFGML